MYNFWFLLCTPQAQGVSKEQIALIIYFIIAILLFSLLFILFFSTFQKRKNKLMLDNIKQQQKFDEELVKTQQEIQEETLKHIGRELHDNVGQLLALASMQMKAVSKVVSEDVKSKVSNATEALNESLNEVRALSKSLNNDVIFNLGFYKTVKNEINRLNKTGLIKAKLVTEGDTIEFENKKDKIILFRILQEFFSNTLKYAEADHLIVVLNYTNSSLVIQVKDDGVGFSVDSAEQGSGMTNMKKRSELVKATFNLESQPNKGTVLTLVYTLRPS